MSPRGGTSRRSTRGPVIVVAGEDSNDRRVMRTVIESLCPAARGRVVEVGDPVRLRDATGDSLAERVRKLVGKARARAAREDTDVACVFVHEDFDAPDSARRAAVLRDLTRHAARQYRESDAPAVVRKAAELRILDQPDGQNASWDEFRADVRDCCGQRLRSGPAGGR